MALDEQILRDVEAARERVEALEDQAHEARAALHAAIRRLHAAGGSLREIATALAMSHQRVHQIIGAEGIVEVEAAAVTAVRPPAAATTSAGEVCSFCGAPRRELDKLLAAPGPVFICGGCVGAALAVVGGGDGGTMRLVPVDVGATCTFCGNPSAVGGVMAEAAATWPRICARCTETCARLAAREPRPPAGRRANRVRCSFCNLSQADARKIIAGPGVHICDGCVGTAGAVLASGRPVKGPRQVVLRPAPVEEGCSFCGAAAAPLVKGGRGRICDQCVALCDDIIREDG